MCASLRAKNSLKVARNQSENLLGLCAGPAALLFVHFQAITQQAKDKIFLARAPPERSRLIDIINS
jgi:hypothetical protein